MTDQDRQHGSTDRTLPPAELLPLGVTSADLAEILFCSSLQPSQPADNAAVLAAIAQSLRAHHGRVEGCAADLAECYGKEPEVACHRMRWCRGLVVQLFPNVPAFG